MPHPLNPRLRPVDVRRIRHDGSTFFVLRDPQGIAEQPLLIAEHFAPILARFDGETEVQRIIHEIEAAYRVRVSRDVIDQLVESLDLAHMLDSERFRQRMHDVRETYRRAPFRPPALAGAGYPATAHDLARLLDDALEVASEVDPAEPFWESGVGLLSPHIDYERGSAVYACVWKRAARAAIEADRVVIFGTDHYGDDAFTLTRQNYATPYGVLPTAKEVVDSLVAALGEEQAFAGELRHRGEHSLELVLAWLHHMRGGRPVEVVPILCGSLSTYLRNGSTPRDDHAIEAVLGVLRAAGAGRRTLVVASGDLSHVGTAFGQRALTGNSRKRVSSEDERLLARMSAGDAEGFFGEIKRVGNRYNVCGVTPIYLTLRLLGQCTGEALAYQVCPADENETSAVSVAGAMFRSEAPPASALGAAPAAG